MLVLLVLLPVEALAAYPSGWQWPTNITSLSRGFSASSHPGVDIAVPKGTPLYAVQDGTILKVYTGCDNHSGLRSGTTCKAAGKCSPNYGYSTGSNSKNYCNNGYGNGICLKTTDGYYVQFAHMTSVNTALRENQKVTKGTLLGYSGDTGSSTGPHCHYAVSTSGEFSGFINPLNITYGSDADPCQTYGCSEAYAGYYRCTSKDGLNINSGHNYSSRIGFIPADEIVWVSKKATSGATYAHVTYNNVSGIASSNYLAKVDSYTLSFYDNGGNGGPGNLTVWNGVTENNSVAVPWRDNYTFNGWYTASSGGIRVYDSNGYCTNEGAYWSNNKYVRGAGATLYAQWTLNDVYVTGITFDSDSETLTVGESKTLGVTVLPSNATNKSLVWTSSDESVAIVSSDGRVTAKGLGKDGAGACVIAAYASDGSGQMAMCTVFVIPPITNLSLNRNISHISLEYPFDRVKLAASLEPSVFTQVYWSSSNPSVAVVDANGLVTAKGEGRAVITASVTQGPSDSCIINVVSGMRKLVLPADTVEVAAEAFANVNADIIVLPNGCEKLGSCAFADNPSLKYVYFPDSIWELYDDTFEGDDMLTIICSESRQYSFGSIPCVTDGGAAYVPVRAVTLDQKEMKLVMFDSAVLECGIVPLMASNRAVIWSSTDPTVATVDENGNVQAKNEGVAIITVTSVDGGYSASCTVTVEKPDVKVSIISNTITPQDELVEFDADLAVTGLSSLDEIGSVVVVVFEASSQECIGEAHAYHTVSGDHLHVYGDTSPSATYPLKPETEYQLCYGVIIYGPHGYISDFVTFTTTAPVKRIYVYPSEQMLKVGETYSLHADARFCDADYIVWRTSNSSVVTVIDGVITAVGPGTATVTACLATDSSVYGECTVIVQSQ